MKNELVISAAMLAALAVLPGFALAAGTATTNAVLADVHTAEAPRVTATVDSRAVTALANTHLALVARTPATGNVEDSLPMNHMQLVLKRSALRQKALDKLIADQHEPSSKKFHQWLTPAQFGQAFGADDADIAAVSSWLKSQGFTVNGVYPNKMQIDFSGTAGMVRQAFHTQESRYALGKETHIANTGDISVPVALQDVVTGVAGLNDFHPQPQHIAPQTAQFDAASHTFALPQQSAAKASFTKASLAGLGPDAVPFTNGTRGFAPYDLVKMYGVDKLQSAGVTGKGITIAVVDVESMVPADWTNFVQQFNLGSYGGTFSQVQPQATGFTNCIDPNIAAPNTDFLETVLDAEWATAMAPGANLVVATCDGSNSTNFFGGVVTAATNLINGDSRPNIISASYGFGEQNVDAASKSAIDMMWAQADAEGISVFVSSGDSGANPSFNNAVINGQGIDANSLGTSPNVTTVGGTDTADVLDGTTKKYFGSTLNAVYGSALSYVPEIPWNQSCGNDVAAKSLGFADSVSFCKEAIIFDPLSIYITSEGGSGGPSSVDAKPAWQRLVRGAAKDQSRDVPDVSLFAGSYGAHSAVILCTAADPCLPNFTGPTVLEGGTSLSAPMFAGIQALVDQGLSASGLPANQGNAAPTLYALAAQEYGGPTGTAPATLDGCSADNGTKGTAKCVFHNVVRGGISTQCYQLDSATTPSPDCAFYAHNPQFLLGAAQLGLMSTDPSKKFSSKTEAFAAQPGWSFATGLGSVDANNLLGAWKKFVGVK
ncbi:S53 family peptidase [Dyella sp.]|uniref:S53 family peptidase n=1 Tax=Dyella sp. TaxID=1869338 RepID=UPI002ED5824E